MLGHMNHAVPSSENATTLPGALDDLCPVLTWNDQHTGRSVGR